MGDASVGSDQVLPPSPEPATPISRLPTSGAAHVAGRPDCLGKVGDQDCHQQRDADALAGGETDAENRLLRDAVQKGAQRQRKPCGSAAGDRPPMWLTARAAAKKATAPTARPMATETGPPMRSPPSASSKATLETSAPAPKASTVPMEPERHSRTCQGP